MNAHQEHLLRLLKEIDGFCRKHGITYYCAGGTVIGAARHGGFIPWDDDIDIYMTRREFRRFTQAFEEDPIPDRMIEYYERAHEHHSTVNRYHETTSTMLCHYHITGYACAGTLIDVFILDPIPDELSARREYLAKFYVLADLESPALSYAHRVPAEYLDLYDKYMQRAEQVGVPETVREISEEIFCHDESECSEYCLRWGSIPLIYPIEAMGDPVYLPFEDMQIPVAHDWYRYLAVHYGCEWTQIPYVETHREHTTILREDVPYTHYYEKRDELFSQEELLRMHQARKKAHIRLSRAGRPFEDWIVALKSDICLAAIEKNMAEADYVADHYGEGALDVGETAAPRFQVMRQLFREGEYGKLLELYEPYFTQQTHVSFMGERMHHGNQYRWFFPVFVELEPGELELILEALLRTGRTRLCEKICGICLRGGRDLPGVKKAQAVIDEINRIAGMYYRGEDEECLRAIEGMEDAAHYPQFSEYRWLAKARTGLTEEEASELARRNGVQEEEGAEQTQTAGSSGASEALWKAWGDHLWSSGQKEEAAEVYRALMQSCRNGMFYRDIIAKGVEVPAIPIERPSVYTGNEVTRVQQHLLEELTGFCEENRIDYCLGKDLARRMVLTGNPGYTYRNREILMDAASAEKLLRLFREEDHEGRRLLCWDNDESLKDFCMFYVDTNSCYCDFRRLEQWRDLGIHITIRILRRTGAPKSYRRRVYYDEFLLNLMNLESTDRGNLKTGKKEMAYRFLQAVTTDRQIRRFHRRLFERSLKAEAAAGGGYYYYTNTRGVRPKKHKIPKKDWEERTQEKLCGSSYFIPPSAQGPQTDDDKDIGNTPPREGIYIYRSSRMSWEDIDPLLDMAGYEALDREEYGKARRQAVKLDDQVEDAWQQVLALDQEE